MADQTYDLIVIGSGPAGPVAPSVLRRSARQNLDERSAAKLGLR